MLTYPKADERKRMLSALVSVRVKQETQLRLLGELTRAAKLRLALIRDAEKALRAGRTDAAKDLTIMALRSPGADDRV